MRHWNHIRCTLVGRLRRLIQVQVKLQHVYPRLSEKSELAPQRAFRDKLPYEPLVKMPFAGHARDLEFGSRRRDLWIEPGP